MTKYEERLLSVKKLYISAKEILAIAENLDPNQNTFLGPINEFRNVLDHLIRSIDTDEHKQDYEINEAKEHLYRAGYDCYELVVSFLGQSINSLTSKYDSEIISTIFPKYYSEIKPELLKLQIQLAKIRSEKTIDPNTKEKSFDEYILIMTQLIEFKKLIDAMIPEFENEKAKKKANSRKKVVNDVLVKAVIAGGSGLIAFLLS